MLLYALYVMFLAWHPGFDADTALYILMGTIALISLINAFGAAAQSRTGLAGELIALGGLAIGLLFYLRGTHDAQYALNFVLVILGMPLLIILAAGLGGAAGRRAGPAPTMWPNYRLPEMARDEA